MKLTYFLSYVYEADGLAPRLDYGGFGAERCLPVNIYILVKLPCQFM